VAVGWVCLTRCEATIGGASDGPAASATSPDSSFGNGPIGPVVPAAVDAAVDSSVRPAVPTASDSSITDVPVRPDVSVGADGAAARDSEAGPPTARDSSTVDAGRPPVVDSGAPVPDAAAPVTGVCVVPTTGSDGFTTRFWDCCKPSCAWSTSVRACTSASNPIGDRNAQSACTGGPAHACYNFAPWAVNGSLAYGFAASTSVACGQCVELSFTGQSNSRASDPGSAAVCGKKMIAQIVNTGGIAGNQFDIMVPGGGVGDFDACSKQWGTSNLGERYGGFMLACQRQSNDYATYKSCTKSWCASVFSGGDTADLLAGCNWLVDWLNVADNPKVKYRQVDCPQEIRARSGL
jgi:hypothetical protein